MTSSPLPVAILGASGYTGVELIRLLCAHPYARIAALTAESNAGKAMHEVFPHLTPLALPDLVTHDTVNWRDIHTVFCCLPHGTTQEIIAGLPEHVKIVDLSADFRLSDVAAYAQWYGHAHRAPTLQTQAVYGLTEHARAGVKGARLVANPGCYPTAAQLPLRPLLASGIIAAEGIVIDAKSGVTGAGRSTKTHLLFTELDGGISAYSIGAHRHTPEIEQGLSAAAGHAVRVRFTPHLMPMNRGILATIYVKLHGNHTVADARACLKQAYDHEPFVHVLAEGVPPTTHQVRGSNHCMMNVFADHIPGHAVIVSVIDNLVKGASGQAIQNWNVMMGWDETLALLDTAWVP